VDKCSTCQYYERRQMNGVSGAPQTGQCRRTAPMLNPVNPKPYLIEGIWPTVRDDDWCGEWKVLARRVDGRPVEATNAAAIGPKALATPMRPAGSVNPPAFGRPATANLSTMAAAPASAAPMSAAPGSD
jgi:hypothetical protein